MTAVYALRAFAPAAAPSRKLMAALFAIVVLLTVGFSPALAEAPVGCDPRPSPQKLDATRPVNIGQLQHQLIYYRCTRYDAEVAHVLDHARAWIERRAGHVKNPALVLDIDETSLSNWKQLYQNQFGYFDEGSGPIAEGNCDFSPGSVCKQKQWERSESAVAIEPTHRLFELAKARHVAVFFITGRRENAVERTATEANLHKARYDEWAHLYMRTPDFDRDKSVAPFKTWARKDIESKHYTIIANVGDQQSDLANGHALRKFKVPNPFYYIP